MTNSILRDEGLQNDATDRRETIVVGVDGSASSHAALCEAARVAEIFHARLEAITVWQQPTSIFGADAFMWFPQEDATKVAESAADLTFGTEWPDWFSAHVAEGDPAKVLIERSAGARMLVVGSRGHGGFVGLLLGSVSSECAEHARCAALIMHSPEPPRMSPRSHKHETENVDVAA